MVCSNGDNAAVKFNCEVCLQLMRIEGWRGLKESDNDGGSTAGKGAATFEVPQEEIVNKGIKELLFSKFM